MTERTLPMLTEHHREVGRGGVSAARRALAALRRPCRPHDWALCPCGLLCARCGRVLDATDDDTRKASALTRLARIGWHRDQVDEARRRLFPNAEEAT